VTKETRTRIIRIAILVGVIGFSVLLFLLRDKIKNLEALGYPGIFLISFFSSATIILPVPGIAFTSAMGMLFNPLWIAIFAGFGSALGEFSGYLAGLSGQKVVENAKWANRIESWMKKYGDITILVLAFIPNPLFDMAGLSAGMLKMPAWRFFLWTLIGKIMKQFIFAYGGATIAHWFSK
jgi:membrane protein YqaA with SNARE-associated domain